jgi:hypothetical protein
MALTRKFKDLKLMNDTDVLNNFEARLENIDKNILAGAQIQQSLLRLMAQFKDLQLDFQTKQLQGAHINPLNSFGKKCFSQTDEDGITLEIVRRLGLSHGVYAEFGVGNGLENNTLILAACGWRGFWVGGEDLVFDYSKATSFHNIKGWITIENILNHAQAGMDALGVSEIDILSLDLDGNDIYFLEKLLSGGIRPKLFIAEYNGKFIPPAKFQIAYDPAHQWIGDDYFGAALTNLVEMFEKHGYRLICCNAHTGANAFFINCEHDALFNDIPKGINDLYVAPRYHLYNAYGHKKSPRVVESIINK